MTEVTTGWRASSPSRPRSPSPTRRGRRCATAASTSRRSSAGCPFENVWGLLIDGAYKPGLPPAEPYNIPIHTGDVRADVQAASRCSRRRSACGRPTTSPTSRPAIDLGRVAVMVLSYAAQAARGLDLPVVPQREVDQGHTLAERFLIRWKGEADPKHVKAIDAYW